MKTQLLQGFTAPDGTALAKSVRTLQLSKEEDSYMSRYRTVRGFAYNLTETAYCVTAGVLDMPVKKRRIYPGTNRSNALGPIGCPPFTSAEAHNLVPWKEKKDFYSASAKIACRVGGSSLPGSEELDRKPETVEPVNVHGYVAVFWEEIIHSHSVAGVVDFTAGAGYLAEACLSEKIPYVGFIQTPTSERILRRCLFKRTWDLMCKPGSAHYTMALRSLAVKEAAAEADPPPPSKAGQKAAASGSGGTGGGAPAGSADGGAPAVNPALLAALKALEQPASKAKGKMNMAVKKEEDDDEGEGDDSMSDVQQ